MIKSIYVEGTNSVSKSRALNSLNENINTWLHNNNISDEYVISIHLDINTSYKTMSSITGVKTCMYNVNAIVYYREVNPVELYIEDDERPKKKKKRRFLCFWKR